jgi:hypothetical protein
MNAIEANCLHKGNAHASTKDILRDPEKGNIVRLAHSEGDNEPCQADEKTNAERYKVKPSDISELFRACSPHNQISHVEPFHDLAYKREDDDLTKCSAASLSPRNNFHILLDCRALQTMTTITQYNKTETYQGVKDFDNIVNLEIKQDQ